MYALLLHCHDGKRTWLRCSRDNRLAATFPLPIAQTVARWLVTVDGYPRVEPVQIETQH
jgi:hypothetical protein